MLRNNRKGVELSLNMIIIAILVLLVLLIMAFLLFGGFNNWNKGTDCKNQGGNCVAKGFSCEQATPDTPMPSAYSCSKRREMLRKSRLWCLMNMKNKKGMTVSTLGKFILVFLVVFALLLLYNRTMKGGTKVLECNTNGGECKTDTCDFVTQIPMLSDKAAGCKTGEICCININKEKPPADPKCEEQILGNSCGTYMVCDWALQCVSKCEFCAKNFGTDEVQAQAKRKVCKDKFDYEGFKCQCTKTQCEEKNKLNNTFCILENHCPGLTTTSQNYACCK